jgi:hypothetical protein
MGGPTIFTPNQEARLAQHCIYMADRGYGYARWQILEIAGNMSKAIPYQVDSSNCTALIPV